MVFYNPTKSRKGFTLIELMVVIAIIAVLSTIIMSNLAKARSKARDAKRIEQFKEMQKAFALYAFDHNGSYPGASDAYSSYPDDPSGGPNGDGFGCSPAIGSPGGQSDLSPLIPKYISELPIDPQRHCYTYTGGGSEYKFWGWNVLENPLPPGNSLREDHHCGNEDLGDDPQYTLTICSEGWPH
jgi:prepilin-type N-terminal cleavage/methylation domain-containing protein